MKLKLRYITRQPQVLERTRQVELSESELQILLDRIGAAEFERNPSAHELLEYLDGRGPFALFVDLSAKHEDVGYLLNRLSKGCLLRLLRNAGHPASDSRSGG